MSLKNINPALIRTDYRLPIQHELKLNDLVLLKNEDRLAIVTKINDNVVSIRAYVNQTFYAESYWYNSVFIPNIKVILTNTQLLSFDKLKQIVINHNIENIK